MFRDILGAIERSGAGEVVRTTPFLYPVLMSLHVLGIALLIGPAFIVDLRLLGMARGHVPVTVTMRHLLPLSHLGFGIVLCTGLPMFSAIALAVGESPAAVWKFGLIVIAGFNILIFHQGIYKTVMTWDEEQTPPTSAKAAALISMLCWTGTVFAGRFLAY